MTELTQLLSAAARALLVTAAEELADEYLRRGTLDPFYSTRPDAGTWTEQAEQLRDLAETLADADDIVAITRPRP